MRFSFFNMLNIPRAGPRRRASNENYVLLFVPLMMLALILSRTGTSVFRSSLQQDVEQQEALQHLNGGAALTKPAEKQLPASRSFARGQGESSRIGMEIGTIVAADSSLDDVDEYGSISGVDRDYDGGGATLAEEGAGSSSDYSSDDGDDSGDDYTEQNVAPLDLERIATEQLEIDKLWLNRFDIKRSNAWKRLNPPLQHDAATKALLADLGACTTLRCTSRVGALLQGRTRFNFPHFFLIGWQKCATTSVNSYLRKHPQMLFGRVKETHWFTACKVNHFACRADNETHYLRDALRIEAAAAGGLEAAAADASADYARVGVSLSPEIYKLFPWLKIVVILRDPISRAISYTRMHTELKHKDKGCGEGETLYACLLRILGPGTMRQSYGRQLEAWVTTFPKGQVSVIQMEEMQGDQQGVLDRLKVFLGMDVEQPQWQLRNVNSRHARRGRPMLRSEYEHLVTMARADARRVAEVLDRHDAGNGAAFVARWEAVWRTVLEEDCDAEGNCHIDSN